MKARIVVLFLVFACLRPQHSVFPVEGLFLLPATSAVKESAVSPNLSLGYCHGVKCNTVSLFNIMACHFVTPGNLFKTLRKKDISLNQGT